MRDPEFIINRKSTTPKFQHCNAEKMLKHSFLRRMKLFSTAELFFVMLLNILAINKMTSDNSPRKHA